MTTLTAVYDALIAGDIPTDKATAAVEAIELARDEPWKRKTEADHADLKTEVREGFARIEARFDQVDDRFKQVDDRFKQVDARFDKVDERLSQIDARTARLEIRMESGFSRMNALAGAIISFQIGLGLLILGIFLNSN